MAMGAIDVLFVVEFQHDDHDVPHAVQRTRINPSSDPEVLRRPSTPPVGTPRISGSYHHTGSAKTLRSGMSGSFSDTLALLRHFTGDEVSLADLIAPHFPAMSVSVMTLGILPATTVSATDARAARIDELQLDLREGPAWDALKDTRPLLEPDLSESQRWPVFSEAISRLDVAALFVFPLRAGHLVLGALTFSCDQPRTLTAEQGAQAGSLAGAVSALLLRRALERVGDDTDLVSEIHSRRTIHQSVGMVIVQARVSATDAELLIRGHAFAENTTMRQVAAEILQRRLTFQPLTMGSED
jgi:hypothetical protein